MSEIMTKEEFIKRIEAMGFVSQEPLNRGNDIYSKQIGKYRVTIDCWYGNIQCFVIYEDTVIALFKMSVFNDKTIEIIKILLRGFDDKNDNENNYAITFNVEDMIKEAEFCGYKINEEQAKELIDYLNRKADGVYETIQQYITGYCQNNKFEELKEDEE